MTESVRDVLNRIFVGRKERVAVICGSIQLGIYNAKIDTGAYSSALCVFDHYCEPQNNTVFFKLKENGHWHLSKLIKTKLVRSSSGCEENRPFIELTVKNEIINKKIMVSLTKNRKTMKSRLLLGRTFTNHDFTVITDSSYLTKGK